MSRKLRSGFWLVCQQQVFECLQSASFNLNSVRGYDVRYLEIGERCSKALQWPCQTRMIFIFPPRSFCCNSLCEKQGADCNIAQKSKDHTMARDEHLWLCVFSMTVYLIQWHIDQHLTYSLAFIVCLCFQVNVSKICGRIWTCPRNHI